jgi:hypothetical protein
MKSKVTIVVAAIMTVALIAPALAAPGKPNFTPSVYADGQAWGTKGTTALPAPTENNIQSFDPLFVFINGADSQLPVGEAAPKNRAYNGGRWITWTAWWTEEGMAAHDPLPVIMSYAELLIHAGLGHIETALGSPEGGPPPYFQCPLLPVKE